MRGEMPPASENEASPVLRRFLRGDARTVERVERAARGVVRQRGYFIPREQREDVVQEALLGVWRAVQEPGFRLEEELETFVRVLAHRRCVDWMRRYRPTVPPDPELASGEQGPEEVASGRERIELGRLVLAAMDQPCREIFRLHVTREMSYREIASAQERSEGAVRTQMYECLKRARQIRKRLERPAVAQAGRTP